MKKDTYFASVAIAGLFIMLAAAINITAQNAKKPEVEKGVFWSDTVTGTEVFLSGEGRLVVITKDDVQVDYHTSINSSVPVDKTLEPAGSSGTTVKYFVVKHHFSRTTIWMRLEFTIGGKKVPALTRTFYDSIFDTVLNEMFYKGGSKLPPK